MHTYQLVETVFESRFARLDVPFVEGEVLAAERLLAAARQADEDALKTPHYRMGQEGEDPIAIHAHNYMQDLLSNQRSETILRAEGMLAAAIRRRENYYAEHGEELRPTTDAIAAAAAITFEHPAAQGR